MSGGSFRGFPWITLVLYYLWITITVCHAVIDVGWAENKMAATLRLNAIIHVYGISWLD